MANLAGVLLQAGQFPRAATIKDWFSKAAGSYLPNGCQHCDAIQADGPLRRTISVHVLERGQVNALLGTFAERMLALLRAARDEAKADAAVSFPGESTGLELIVTSPVPPPSDAADYLGGVADVLEDKGAPRWPVPDDLISRTGARR